jgi:multidrug resistance efflux pump
MNEQTNPAAAEDTAAEAPEQDAAAEAKASVSKGLLLMLLLILLSLLWYFFADRFTPHTDQARVQGFVVGVAPKVAGLVTKVWVRNNQEVDEGAPLFEIDKSNYQIALKRAESDLQNTESQVGAGDAGIESARASLRAARANALKARQDADRQERLYQQDSGTISVRRLEVARASLEQARAKVSQAEAEVQRAIEQKGGDDEDNAKLKSALSAVEKARLDLTNTVVRAASRGVITDLRADVGQFAGAGTPVMTLIPIHDVWISAEFTENNLGHMKVGGPVEIALDALPGRVFTGEVASIGLGVSASQPPPAGTLPSIQNNRDWLRQAQRFPVVIAFDPDQDEQLVRHLRIGGQADIIAYTEGHPLLQALGRAYIRLLSWLSYAY